MKKCNEDIVRLIQLYLSGGLTDEEKERLDRWCDSDVRNRDFLDSLIGEELFSQEFPLYNRIDEEKAIRCFETTTGWRKRYLLRQVMKYAAILVLSLWGVVVWQLSRQQPMEVAVQEILPGSAKAVLTLADGKQVSLTGEKQDEVQWLAGVKQEMGVLAYDSLNREDSRQMKYNTLATGRGGEYRLILADGTKVFLNAASTLKYPVTFIGKERKVELEGEAYFEVAKDATHAFIVVTKGVEVKVYGTAFNINTIRVDEIQTVLVEGSIGVRTIAGGKEYRVRPGQMAVWKETDGSVKLNDVDVNQYIAWKDGVFRFSNERLEDILTTLSNWYDVDMFYQSEHIKNLHFSGYMERYEQIGTILEAVTTATGVKFSVQGKTIVVSE